MPGTQPKLIFSRQPPVGYTIKLTYRADHDTLYEPDDDIHESIPLDLLVAQAKVVLRTMEYERSSGNARRKVSMLNLAIDELEATPGTVTRRSPDSTSPFVGRKS